MTKKFIPNDFEVPTIFETDKFRLRIHTINDVERDYTAIITSTEHLHKTQPFGPRIKWPPKDFTLDENRIAIGLHQKEFKRRISFAFAVMNLDETKCLGCMYIYPSHIPRYDALVMMWVRQSEVANGLDEILFSNVKKWIQDKWPFEKVAYPGRDNNWNEFK